jgi:hypothetical protein
LKEKSIRIFGRDLEAFLKMINKKRVDLKQRVSSLNKIEIKHAIK